MESGTQLPFGKRPPMGTGSWRMRRAFMFIMSGFCMSVIVWILYRNMDTQVAETAVTMSFFALISIVGSYVFGAVWQDVNTIKTQGGWEDEGWYDGPRHHGPSYHREGFAGHRRRRMSTISPDVEEPGEAIPEGVDEL